MSQNRLTLRAYLSGNYLYGACLTADLARQMEETEKYGNQDEYDKNKEINNRHQAYIISSIASTVGFLEAAINEFFSDAEHEAYQPSLSREIAKNLDGAWKLGIERFSTLEKYQIAQLLSGRDPFDTGSHLYSNAHLVITVRNMLVHYKVEDIVLQTGTSESIPLHRLERKLRNKFPLNPFAEWHSDNDPTMEDGKSEIRGFFPSQCLSYGCAKWAIKSCLDFANKFFDELGVMRKYGYAIDYMLKIVEV